MFFFTPYSVHCFSRENAFGIILGFGRVQRGNPQCSWDTSHVTSNRVTCSSKLKVKTRTHTDSRALRRSGMALLVGSRVVFQTLRPQTLTSLDYFCRFQDVMLRAAAGSSGGRARRAANGGLRQFSSDANDLSVRYLDGDDSGRRQLAIRSHSVIKRCFLVTRR